MLLRVALFTLMAIGLGGFGTVAWYSMRPAPPPVTQAEAPPPHAMMLAAAHPLRAGSLLKPEDVTAQDVIATDLPAGAKLDTPVARAELIGAMIRRSLAQSEALLPADLLHPGDHGFLAAVLGAGKRAISVGVDAVSGTAGLIWPGDRVDLVLTQSQDDVTLPAGKRVSAETVLTDVRVIAIDQQLVQGASPGVSDAQPARTVTLEVSPPEAERVAVAVKLGRLSLAVRSADPAPDTDAVAGTDGARPVTWGGDVSSALSLGHQGGSGTLTVFQGAADGKEFHF